MKMSIGKRIKNAVKSRPWLFDLIVQRVKRQILGKRGSAYSFLDEFSRSRGGRLTFVQIGANDGLRNDPVREFVVRDQWSGVFVEPLPTVFPDLRRNYEYLTSRRKLAFENVAISSALTSLPFFTFQPELLKRLSDEQRLDLLRKSSFDREHVAKFAKTEDDVLQINVPCAPVGQIIEKHFRGKGIDLLVIDAEGHEGTILRSIDFAKVRISGIFFESRHLGKEREPLFSLLAAHGYSVREAEDDAFASKDSPADSRAAKG